MVDAMEGGCDCGLVRYRLAGAPIFVNCCHCRDCQRSSGSAFAVNAMIEADRVHLLGNEAPRFEIDPGEGTEEQGTARCPACGTKLWATHRFFGAAIRFIHAGTLDAAEALVPNAHFFTRSKHGWVALPEDVPAFETLPGEGETLFDEAARSRLAAALGR